MCIGFRKVLYRVGKHMKRTLFGPSGLRVVPPSALGGEESPGRLRWPLYRICIGFINVLYKVGKHVKRTLFGPSGFRNVLDRVRKGVTRTPPGHSPISCFSCE